LKNNRLIKPNSSHRNPLTAIRTPQPGKHRKTKAAGGKQPQAAAGKQPSASRKQRKALVM